MLLVTGHAYVNPGNSFCVVPLSMGVGSPNAIETIAYTTEGHRLWQKTYDGAGGTFNAPWIIDFSQSEERFFVVGTTGNCMSGVNDDIITLAYPVA